MKKTNSNILLTALGLIFSSANVYATECTPAPDCASLGYNKTAADCEGLSTIKCPFDTSKIYCSQGASVSQDVSVGAIVYGDGTVSRDLIAGKKPIGIVFDIFNRLAVALTDVKQNGSAGSEMMHWARERCDTPNLENCTDSSTVTISCGLDGRANTDAILASTCHGTTYAANAVNAYQTSNCSKDFCQQGKWFLPSMIDLNTIYYFTESVNSSLTLLVSIGASKMQEDYYWSSTESFGSYAWKLNMDNGNKTNYLTDSYGYVRPVVKF